MVPQRHYLRVTEAVLLPPLSETVVPVQCPDEDIQLLEALDTTYQRKQITMSNGIADLSANVSFAVKIANLLRTPVTLRKQELVGHAIPAPIHVNAISFAGDPAKTPNEGGVAFSLRGSKTSASSEGIKSSETATEEFSVDDVNLSHLTTAERDEVRDLLGPFADMWNGKLCIINVTQHRIELKPGAAPVHAQPYRAGPNARSVEEEHVKNLLDAGVVEPAQSE